MRIMHLNPAAVKTLTVGTIYGSDRGSIKIFDYPTKSFGSGTGPHVHIDFTKNLPYSGEYYRQFINPDTLRSGTRFNYSYWYKDATYTSLPGYPQYFGRY